MTLDELLARVGDHVGVRRVFGEPIEREGTTVIPVAVVAGGGGGGQEGPDAAGGGGFGVWARGIGVYEIRDGGVRCVPAVDVVAIVMAGAGLACMVGSTFARRRGCCRRARG